MAIDEEMDRELVAELLGTVDTLLIGRVLYQGFVSYWPAVATNPSSPPGMAEFARWVEDAPKVVFSKTLEKAEWKNSRIVRDNIAEEVAKLKKRPKDMVIFGGAGIVSTFMELDLIDEYRIKVHPVVLGSGKPLWQGAKSRMNLKLLKSMTYCSGVVALYYAKA
jgi:dihydrofolate reductase